MENHNDQNQFGRVKRPRIFNGFVLVAAGLLLLGYKMGAPIPSWIFTWQVLLIAIGLLTGVRSGFHNPGSFVMIAVGTIFLIDQTNPQLHFHNYILPTILISVGLVYIFRPGKIFGVPNKKKWRNVSFIMDSPETVSSTENLPDKIVTTEEENVESLEINAVLGGVKKIILSKNFKGGEINCFMGGAEINLSKADIKNTVVLEINNVFGGTKLIIPSNWDVKMEVSAVFGGMEDKRSIAENMPDIGKILILRGTCVFGGIEIANY